MNGPVHRVIGVTTALGLAVGLGGATGNILTSEVLGHNIFPLLGAITAGSAALLPDKDMKINPKIHRGVTHSLLAIGVLVVFDWYLSSTLIPGIFSSVLLSLYFGVIVGYASHIWADLHNGAGEALLWPVPIKFHIMRISTGTWEEYAWAATVVIISLAQAIGGINIV